ncbi:MAG: DNA alkylation repair protein [Myxococcota bacterium]
MSVDEVLAALSAAADPQFAKTYRRHGAADPVYGVSTANLRTLAKKIRRDPALARALWDTGIYDAMTLAAMVADPAQLTDDEADAWLGSVRCYAAAGALAGVVGRSPVGLTRASAWIESPAEYTRTTGYDTLCVLLRDGAGVEEAWLRGIVARIEAEVGGSANRARHAMNMALIAIGAYRPALRAEVEAAALRIGPIRVDHGDTACVTPDIVPYLAKMAARAGAKLGRI